MLYPIIVIRKFLSGKAAVALLAALFLAFNAIWIWHHRISQILDIDEAGYLGIAIYDYRAFMARGLLGWIQQVKEPSIQAPITTALASLLFIITGPSFFSGIAIPLFAGVVTIVASYMLARCLMPAPGALLSAALVASCPIIVNYSRSIHFAMPATAVMTIALVCMLRSRHFSSLSWAILFGIFLGLLPLTRTMTIGFMPGLIIGAALQVAVKKSQITRRILIFGFSLIITAATAATWLIFNGRLVFGYLFDFGYGNRAAEYGDKQSIMNIDAWSMTGQIFLNNIYLPHALVLLLGLVAAAIIAFKSLCHKDLLKSAYQLRRSPIFCLLIVFVAGISALTSSQNKGTAFIAPLIPLAFVTAVYLIHRLIQKSSPNQLPRTIAIVAGIMVCVIAIIPLTTTSIVFAHPREVKIPILGWPVKFIDGRSTIQLYEQGMLDAADEGQTSDAFSPSEPLSPAQKKAYASLIDSIAQELEKSPWRTSGGIAFGFRHLLLNLNTINLSALFHGDDILPISQVAPLVTGDTVEGYYNWLIRDDASDACLLLTINGDAGQFLPIVTKPYVLQAAQKAGFSYQREWLTPSGQTIRLWKRSLGPRPCYEHNRAK